MTKERRVKKKKKGTRQTGKMHRGEDRDGEEKRWIKKMRRFFLDGGVRVARKTEEVEKCKKT